MTYKKYTPHNYQRTAEKHVIDNTHCALFLEMGLGKTITTLSAIVRLKRNGSFKGRVLIIGPKRVIEHTWAEEIKTWEHTKDLKLSIITGTPKQRMKAIYQEADIYAVSRDNIAWLVSLMQTAWRWDWCVIDELSSFKNHDSKRHKALRQVMPYFKRVTGLTGTPTPNGLADLWPQVYLLDYGERLGKTLGSFRAEYFTSYRKHGVPKDSYRIRKGDPNFDGEDYYEKAIYDQIGDICISMKAEDWLDMPERIDLHSKVYLPPNVMEAYREFERDKVYELIADNATLTAVNAGALVNKLLQFANGAVYDESGDYWEVHNEKIEALGERMEAAQGKPVLVLYSYKHDVARIQKHLKEFKPQLFKGPDTVDKWNRGEISMLVGHPQSMGHGLNMQYGGNWLEWFGVPWSAEAYQQTLARLYRQGQRYSVINSRLCAPGTMEDKVLAAQDDKAAGQNLLMNALKAHIDEVRQRHHF